MTIRIKRPDKKNAESILIAAERDMRYTLSLELNENSSATIVRNIYECFRMLGDAILVAKGISSEGHTEQINELMKIKADTKRPISSIGNLRQLRHSINYDGYAPKINETQDVISLADACFFQLLDVIRKEINN